eukprot:INCI6227.4.p2 GENE.INCI6227.4~~INCI6227.4.p2  ORF type:complete len:672 (+),score=149.52 INCI6227.4:197-2212(+)
MADTAAAAPPKGHEEHASQQPQQAAEASSSAAGSDAAAASAAAQPTATDGQAADASAAAPAPSAEAATAAAPAAEQSKPSSEEPGSEKKDGETQEGELVPARSAGCVVCEGYNWVADVLLCDGPGCNKEYHLACLTPPLTNATIPAGDFLGPCCNGKDPNDVPKWDWQVGMGAYAKSMRSRKKKNDFFMCSIVAVDKGEARGRPYKIHFLNTKAKSDEWVDAAHLRHQGEYAAVLKARAIEAQKLAEAKAAAQAAAKAEKAAARAKKRAEQAALRAAERKRKQEERKEQQAEERARRKAEKAAIKAAERQALLAAGFAPGDGDGSTDKQSSTGAAGAASDVAAGDKGAASSSSSAASSAAGSKKSSPKASKKRSAASSSKASKSLAVRNSPRCKECGCAANSCSRFGCSSTDADREAWTKANGGKLLVRPGRSKVKICTRCGIKCWAVRREVTRRRRKAASTADPASSSGSDSDSESSDGSSDSDDSSDDEDTDQAEEEVSDDTDEENEEPLPKFTPVVYTCGICKGNKEPGKMLVCEQPGCKKMHHLSCLPVAPVLLPGEPFIGPCCEKSGEEGHRRAGPVEVYVVESEFAATNKDQLTLAPNESIRVLERRDDGWIRGSLLSSIFDKPPSGWFPAKHVKKVCARACLSLKVPKCLLKVFLFLSFFLSCG